MATVEASGAQKPRAFAHRDGRRGVVSKRGKWWWKAEMVDADGRVTRAHESQRLRDVEQWLMGRGFAEVKP